MPNIYLASPRGFCSGVRRAVGIVKNCLMQYGAPIYVLHEIVHNRHVVEDLETQGVVFVESLDDADVTRPLIFSAHGVPEAVVRKAQDMGFKSLIDATCPLVEKVHRQIRKYAQEKLNIVVIGKSEHPEIIGTVGQIPDYKQVRVIKKIEDIASLPFDKEAPIGFVTQTTLSVSDTKELISELQQKYPKLSALKKDDICYATTNRQAAVRALAKECSVVVILGSKNSSNSKQLQTVALESGAKKAFLIDDKSEFPWDCLQAEDSLGISAGASAPEYLVQDLLTELQNRYENIKVHDVIIATENITFKH